MRFLHEPSQARMLGATLSHAVFYRVDNHDFIKRL